MLRRSGAFTYKQGARLVAATCSVASRIATASSTCCSNSCSISSSTKKFAAGCCSVTACCAASVCEYSTSSSSSVSASSSPPSSSSSSSSGNLFRQTRVALCSSQQKSHVPDVNKYAVGGRDATGDEATGEFDFDIVVIGGGSGGLAAAKRASINGAKVALCDFVAPSPLGTTWGLGGTCVNVGCIPKKLMHTAALVGETIRHAASSYGFGAEEEPFDHSKALKEGEKTNSQLITFSWSRLRNNVRDHIRGLNFGYLGELRDKEVTYFNALASFVDKHTIKTVDKKGREKTIRARRFVIATGGRPSPLTIPGGEHAISSDDLFFSPHAENPGKTLVVGAGYIALECAGLLHSLGFPCTVMARSVPLRVMDQQSAQFVTNDLTSRIGVKIMTGTQPSKIVKDAATGKLHVEFTEKGNTTTEEFDTVLAAVGRYAESHKLNLEAIGVDVHPRTKKIMTNRFDRTSVDNIYAVGDVAQLCPELTPVAIRAGKLLADRLYVNPDGQTIDYRLVPTTVFTPLEYGFVGHSEETAFSDFGAENVESYVTSFTPLEWTVPHLPTDACFMKLIVEKKTDKVLGFHVVSPNAGEITQGVAVALQCGATRADFLNTIGIHPTIAEDMTNLTITKSSGASIKKGGC